MEDKAGLSTALALYYDTLPDNVRTLDLCRGDDDLRWVYIADDGQRRLAVKRTSNAFTDASRIAGWARLAYEYRRLGIYCPATVTNRHGELSYKYSDGGRDFYIYAEEFAKYETAEQIGEDKLKDETGRRVYLNDLLRSVGRVAAARFDFFAWPSGYCLLQPFAPPDTTDEGTECALRFRDLVLKDLPQFVERTEKLMRLFYRVQDELRAVYPSLPVSCFQADLNDSNVLLGDSHDFAGLIDFNLSGREPVLNYAVRAALWNTGGKRLYDGGGHELFWYDSSLDRLRTDSFERNLALIGESYRFSDAERSAFLTLFRYVNSFWWQHIGEIGRVKNDAEKVGALLDWLERQLTRSDIALP